MRKDTPKQTLTRRRDTIESAVHSAYEYGSGDSPPRYYYKNECSYVLIIMVVIWLAIF